VPPWSSLHDKLRLFSDEGQPPLSPFFGRERFSPCAALFRSLTYSRIFGVDRTPPLPSARQPAELLTRHRFARTSFPGRGHPPSKTDDACSPFVFFFFFFFFATGDSLPFCPDFLPRRAVSLHERAALLWCRDPTAGSFFLSSRTNPSPFFFSSGWTRLGNILSSPQRTFPYPQLPSPSRFFFSPVRHPFSFIYLGPLWRNGFFPYSLSPFFASSGPFQERTKIGSFRPTIVFPLLSAFP